MFDGKNADFQFVAVGGLVFDPFFNTSFQQCRTERGFRAHDLDAFAALFDVADEVALGHVIVVTFVDDGDGAPDGDGSCNATGHDLVVFEDGLERADAGFHVALLVFRGVVVTVLGEVTHFAGTLDLLGYLDATSCGEIVVFGLQAVESDLGELMACHLPQAIGGNRGCLPGGSLPFDDRS